MKVKKIQRTIVTKKPLVDTTTINLNIKKIQRIIPFHPLFAFIGSSLLLTSVSEGVINRPETNELIYSPDEVRACLHLGPWYNLADLPLERGLDAIEFIRDFKREYPRSLAEHPLEITGTLDPDPDHAVQQKYIGRWERVSLCTETQEKPLDEVYKRLYESSSLGATPPIPPLNYYQGFPSHCKQKLPPQAFNLKDYLIKSPASLSIESQEPLVFEEKKAMRDELQITSLHINPTFAGAIYPDIVKLVDLSYQMGDDARNALRSKILRSYYLTLNGKNGEWLIFPAFEGKTGAMEESILTNTQGDAFDRDAQDWPGFIAYNSKQNVLAILFRGSHFKGDWVHDVASTVVNCQYEDLPGHGNVIPEPKLACHSGFLTKYNYCRAQLREKLLEFFANLPSERKNTLKVVISGHSLGAAMASVSSLDISAFLAPFLNSRPPYVFLFASPTAWTEDSIKTLYKRIPRGYIARLQAKIDAVPLVEDPIAYGKGYIPGLKGGKPGAIGYFLPMPAHELAYKYYNLLTLISEQAGSPWPWREEKKFQHFADLSLFNYNLDWEGSSNRLVAAGSSLWLVTQWAKRHDFMEVMCPAHIGMPSRFHAWQGHGDFEPSLVLFDRTSLDYMLWLGQIHENEKLTSPTTQKTEVGKTWLDAFYMSYPSHAKVSFTNLILSIQPSVKPTLYDKYETAEQIKWIDFLLQQKTERGETQEAKLLETTLSTLRAKTLAKWNTDMDKADNVDFNLALVMDLIQQYTQSEKKPTDLRLVLKEGSLDWHGQSTSWFFGWTPSASHNKITREAIHTLICKLKAQQRLDEKTPWEVNKQPIIWENLYDAFKSLLPKNPKEDPILESTMGAKQTQTIDPLQKLLLDHPHDNDISIVALSREGTWSLKENTGTPISIDEEALAARDAINLLKNIPTENHPAIYTLGDLKGL